MIGNCIRVIVVNVICITMLGCAGYIKQIPVIGNDKTTTTNNISVLKLEYNQMKYLHMNQYEKQTFLDYYTNLGKQILIKKGVLNDSLKSNDTLTVKITENSYYRIAGIKSKSMIPFVLFGGFSLTIIPTSIHLDIIAEAQILGKTEIVRSEAKETILYFLPMMFMIGSHAPYMIRDKIYEALITDIANRLNI